MEDKTGEGIYRRQSYTLSQVSLNGDEGVFYYRDKNAEKDEQTGKYPKKALTKPGEPLQVVFLKIRRVLAVFKKGKRGNTVTNEGFSTSEHNSKADFVMLFGKNEVGVADDLRAKYPDLRTQQIVYCYVPSLKEVVRLVVKGASLGSQENVKGVLKFYDYLQSFSNDEHSHEFLTNLVPITEEGPKGKYYAISFQKGPKLDDMKLKRVKELIDDVHENVTRVDEGLKEKIGKRVATPGNGTDVEQDTVRPDAEDTSMAIEYPTDDIDPDDIPF